MAQQLTSTNPSIILPTHKTQTSAQDIDKTSLPQFLQGLTKLFWSYTDKSGEAETSSFNGIL